MADEQQGDGWNVVSTAALPPAKAGDWDVVGTASMKAPAAAPVVRLAAPPAQTQPSGFNWHHPLDSVGFNLMHPIDNIRSNVQSLEDVGKGIAKSVPGTLAGIDDLVAKIPGVGTALTTPLVGGTSSSQARQDLHNAAETHNAAQAGGKVVGNLAQFAIPGGAEEAAAEKVATLAPKVAQYAPKAETLIAPFARIGARALGAGTVNKVQGGSFADGAALGGAGEVVGQGVSALAPGVIAAVKDPVDAVASMFRGNINEPVAPGSPLTYLQRFKAAKNVGVNLDAADASGSPILVSGKRVNRDSFAGTSTYDRATAANLNALDQTATNYADDMSSLSRQDGGGLLKQELATDHAGLRNGATKDFQTLHYLTGGAPVPGASAVGATARGILDQNAPFWEKYPSLKPSNAVSALRDLSKVGDTATYPELQRLRSNTFELSNANNDLIKDEGTAMLQRMTGTLDDTITDDGLTPEQTIIFRSGNAKYRNAKENYDSPSSPLYHAVRTDNPDTLPASLTSGPGKQTVSTLQNLRPRIGEDGVGVLQRHVYENALGSTNDGGYNFKGFGSRLNKLPDDYRAELFGDKNDRLNDLATTSNLLSRDLNPSGSAKQLQKVGEASLFAGALSHPLGAATAALQYPLARLINSPRFVEAIMRDSADAAEGGLKIPPVLPGGGGNNGQPQLLPQAPSATLKSTGLRDFSSLAPKAPYLAPAPARVAGQAVEGLDGADTQLHTASGTLPSRYRVVEADSLTPSHNAQNSRPTRTILQACRNGITQTRRRINSASLPTPATTSRN